MKKEMLSGSLKSLCCERSNVELSHSCCMISDYSCGEETEYIGGAGGRDGISKLQVLELIGGKEVDLVYEMSELPFSCLSFKH